MIPNKYKQTSLLMLCILLIVLGILAIGLKIRYSPQRCVDELIEAMEEENYQALRSLIRCKDVAITEDTLQPLIALYHDNATFRSDLIHTLQNDLKHVELDTYNNQSWIQLVPHRKFIVRTYTIQIQPILVSLSSNIDDVTVQYANQEETLTEEMNTKDLVLLPGLYTFDATHYDADRDKEYQIRKTFTLCSDQSVILSFPCSTLRLDLPMNYDVTDIRIDGMDMTNRFEAIDDTLQFAPVFAGEYITVTCNNTWKRKVMTTFTIPEEFIGSQYEHVCDFNSTSMEFQYPEGLEVRSITINGSKVKQLTQYLQEETHSIVLSDLTDATTIVTKLKAPWGEVFTDQYTVTQDNFDQYTHIIECELSNSTIKEILNYASKYYYRLFDALNSDDINTLERYAEDDEMANDFYVMLQNIAYDYETFADQVTNYEEDILLEPYDLTWDSSQLSKYSNVMTVNLYGKVNSTVTSMNEDLTTPLVESGEVSYPVVMHLEYNQKKGRWDVMNSYYNYEEVTETPEE